MTIGNIHDIWAALNRAYFQAPYFCIPSEYIKFNFLIAGGELVERQHMLQHRRKDKNQGDAQHQQNPGDAENGPYGAAPHHRPTAGPHTTGWPRRRVGGARRLGHCCILCMYDALFSALSRAAFRASLSASGL